MRLPAVRALGAVVQLLCLLLALSVQPVQAQVPRREAERMLRRSFLLTMSGQLAAARVATRAALDRFAAAGDERGQAECLTVLGAVADRERRYVEALDLYRRSAEHWRRAGDRLGLWFAVYSRAELARFVGDLEAAAESYGEGRASLAALAGSREPLSLEALRGIALGLGLESEDLSQAVSVLPRDWVLHLPLVLTLTGLGQLEVDRGRYAEALEVLDEARRLSRELGILDARVFNGIAQAYLGQERYAEALEMLERAMDRSDALVELVSLPFPGLGAVVERVLPFLRADEMRALTLTARVHHAQGRYAEALARQHQALELARAMRDEASALWIRNDMGATLASLGRYAEAREMFEEALGTARASGITPLEALSEGQLGALDALEDRHEEALRHQARALEIARRLGDRRQEAETLVNRSRSLLALDRNAEAVAGLETAARLAEALGSGALRGRILHELGFLHQRFGRPQRALELCLEAATLAGDLGQPEQRSEALLCQAVALRALKRPAEALERSAQALTLTGSLGETGAAAHLVHARLLLEAGRLEEARMHYQQAEELFVALGSELGRATARAGLGMVAYRRGAAGEALGYLEGAAALLDGVARSLRVDELAMGLWGQEDVHRALVSLYSLRGEESLAFEHAEQARARVFLRRLGRRWLGLTRDPAVGSFTRLRRHLAALESAAAAAAGDLGSSTDSRVRLRQEVEEARARYREGLVRLRLEHREEIVLAGLETVSLEQLRDQLTGEARTVVCYFVLQDRLLAWRVEADGSTLLELGIGEAELESVVGRLRDSLVAGDFDREAAGELYRRIWQPLEAGISHERVTVVPHGPLHELPFPALWDAGRQRFLAEDHALSLVPSASAFTVLARAGSSSGGRLLALGDPDGTLAGAAATAEDVAALYGTAPLLGERATETAFRRDAPRADVVHLAAHGLLDAADPMFHALALAPDGENDGRLEVHEIVGAVDLRKTDLVVLASCWSGVGRRSRGDEVTGLARAFLAAGSRLVVTAGWEVDDLAAGELMRSFHRHLRDGLPADEALRRVQLDLARDPDRGGPSVWAGFSLHGDPEE